jgi:hypothetical protein
LPLGANEDLLTSAPEVKHQAESMKQQTQTPYSDEPEVKATEDTHTPKLIALPIKQKSYEKAIHKLKFWNRGELVATVRREPNKWDVIGSLVVNSSDGVQIAWTPQIGQDSVQIYNQSTSAGNVYVAPSQEKLQSNPIRGKPIPPGATFTLSCEAGAFMVAPSGATIDIVKTWYDYEDED